MRDMSNYPILDIRVIESMKMNCLKLQHINICFQKIKGVNEKVGILTFNIHPYLSFNQIE